MNEEWFDLINRGGEVIGYAPRAVCHQNPGLMHQAVHVLVFSKDGRLFLQKRSANKDIQPDRWDTSVGGHPNRAEPLMKAAEREMREELGVIPSRLDTAYSYRWRSDVETEMITTFVTIHDGPFKLDPVEISEGRFWPLDKIRECLGDGIFTPQFTREFSRIVEWCRHSEIARDLAWPP